MRRLLLLTPLLLAAACASDSGGGDFDSVGEMRSASVAPERQVPPEIVEMREDMAEMRADTLSRLDQVMGGAPGETGFWYTPIFDAIDFAMSFTRFFY